MPNIRTPSPTHAKPRRGMKRYVNRRLNATEQQRREALYNEERQQREARYAAEERRRRRRFDEEEERQRRRRLNGQPEGPIAAAWWKLRAMDKLQRYLILAYTAVAVTYGALLYLLFERFP